MHVLTSWLTLIGMTILVVTCRPEGPAPRPAASASVDFPDWVLRGSGVCPGEEPALCGVGEISGVKSAGLAAATATSRGQGSVGRQLQQLFGMLLKEAMLHEAPFYTPQQIAFYDTCECLPPDPAPVVVKHASFSCDEPWVNPVDQSTYVLCRLPLASVSSAIDALDFYLEEGRAWLQSHLGRVFERYRLETQPQ